MHRAPREPGLLWPALWRLALAGGLFILVYGFCNHATAARGDVPILMFEWERHMPFVKEMVVPYWSLDLFFCGAFFLCSSRVELNLLTRRLVCVILLSGVFFLLFPLQLGLPRPEPAGWTAPLFQALYLNDLPYNLAPSLHISLRSLVWVCYGAHLTGWLRRITKVWFILIGASTLLIWQHHVMDVATGFLMGWAVAVLIPDPRQPGTLNPCLRLASRYAVGAVAFAALTPSWLGFGWPAVACGIMALAYFTGRSRLLGKENGALSPGAEWCLLPVLLTARCYQRRWLRRTPAWRELGPGLLWGRQLSASEAAPLIEEGNLAVLNLTAESNAPAAFRERAAYHNLPLLDLVPLRDEHIGAALAIVRAERCAGRRVYLHCQLGLQRSALIAAHWLVETGAASDLEAALDEIRRQEPLTVLPDAPKDA